VAGLSFGWEFEGRARPDDYAEKRDRAMPRDQVTLSCTECKERNYTTTKNKRLHPDRLEHKKYCPRCRKHVTHKETR
jgi:large subunit ribosomal protein L33